MGSILSMIRSATAPPPPRPAPVHPLKALHFDTKAINEKYQAEKAKRLRPDGITQFKQVQGAYARFKDDVAAPPAPRDPIVDPTETKVVIIGAGFAGLVTAVKLLNRGVDNFFIVDKGAGFGGTWYWNQYPGVACDVESYIYLPFLEETGYIPKDRFAYGPEIREHVERVVAKWDLGRRALLQTEITGLTWDEGARRWRVRTNRGDSFASQFVVLATGTFHEPKLPGLPGIQGFQRPQFHSGRWDYSLTGGDARGEDNMPGLADKTVGIIGTGASAVQLVPQLARSARKVYVFQRTPSSISFRENRKTDIEAMAAEAEQPGWQQHRMDVFANVLQGTDLSSECSAVEGLEAFTMQELFREATEAGCGAVEPAQIPELLQLADLRLMEKIRAQVDAVVRDGATAAKLKPWYSFMCKRPAFHNDYLAAFNQPNVELVDTDGAGVERLTPTAVVANGAEYEVDLLVHATGFDFEIGSDFYRRTGIELIGKAGQTLDEAWEANGGPATLFGIHLRGFPNLFNIGPVQAGVTANWTHTTYVAGEHIAAVAAAMILASADDKENKGAPSFESIEPTREAAEDWGRQMDEGGDMRLQFAKSCPPGYYNKEGKPEELSARYAYYPKGIMEWTRVMREWRDEGSMKGMEKH